MFIRRGVDVHQQRPAAQMRAPIRPAQAQVMSMHLNSSSSSAAAGRAPVRSGQPGLTLRSVPSLQCHTMPSARPSGLSWNHNRSCWKSTGGGFLTPTLPCDTRQCTGCFLQPSSVRKTSCCQTVALFPASDQNCCFLQTVNVQEVNDA